MPGPEPLSPESLRWRCDADRLDFATTDDLESLSSPLGQERAVTALRTAMGIRRLGYNVFALGPESLHKREVVQQVLGERAAQAPAPSDWCYVHNFDEAHRPRALELPSGKARRLAQALDRLVEDATDALEQAFQSPGFRERQQHLEKKLQDRQKRAVSEVEQEAERKGVALRQTPMGLGFQPMKGGEAVSPDQLSEDERKRVEETVEELQQKLKKSFQQAPAWAREAREELQRLKRDTARRAIEVLFQPLVDEFTGQAHVQEHLRRIEDDMAENADAMVATEQQGEGGPMQALQQLQVGVRVRQYRAHPVVEHGAGAGAPVYFEDNPTYDRLVGRIEHRSEMGALTTDFSLIRAGALHRANGGYLIVDARKLLSWPLAYDALKRALRSAQVRIEPPMRALGLPSTLTLEPEPIPLDVQVVLLGERFVYDALYQLDPEFEQLFKVPADFEDRVDRNGDGPPPELPRLVATLVRNEALRPFDRSAVAQVLEHGARLAGDAHKLSIRAEPLADVMREADFHAREREGDGAHVTAGDVRRAIEAQEHRLGRLGERVREAIGRHHLLVDTESVQVGQVNALSVSQFGAAAFGRPIRVTARVRLGEGEVVDIERQAKLGGRVHSKGVLILAGFLGGRYARNHPLSLSASIVFEQSYAAVEGDSASLAELLALLGAIAEMRLRQDVAVTGSVSQHGEVQPVGAVNEKIEAFFDVCADRGLTGKQGVLIPAANVDHLMLRPRVIDAVREGRFHVWPVRHVDEALELVGGVPAGERASGGGPFPEDSFNRRVEDALVRMAGERRSFGRGADED